MPPLEVKNPGEDDEGAKRGLQFWGGDALTSVFHPENCWVSHLLDDILD
jgi:hypothetical protein